MTHDPVEVSIDRAEYIKLIRHDCITFFVYYIGEDLTLEIPQMHIDVWNELLVLLDQISDPMMITGHLQKLFAIPRDHSKSTIAKLAVILFMRYSPLKFTMYVSKTATVATAAIRDVVTWLQKDEQLYGAPRIFKKNETEGIWIMDIMVPLINGLDFRPKRIVLKAVGQGHQVRGTLIENIRPDFLVMDDIEDLDTADSGDQQSKLDDWTLGSLIQCTAKRSFRLFLGNMIRSTTLLARLSKDPEWNPTVFGALVRDKVSGSLEALWPGRWTVEQLLNEYRTYRRLGKGHVWEAEKMNLSGDKLLTARLDNAIIAIDPSPEDVTCGFLCIDPAFGLKPWNDNTAITVHVRTVSLGIPVVCDSRVGKWTEEQLLDNLIELSYQWNICTWVIETQAAQRLFIPLFGLLLKVREIPPEVFTILPIAAGSEKKANRILAYRQAIAARSYAVSESQIDLKMRLEEYSPDTKEHDDLCDSGSFGPLVWETYGTVIEAAGIQQVAGRLMQATGNRPKDLGEINVCPI